MIKYNGITGQGTHGDGTPFWFDSTGQMVNGTREEAAAGLHPEADARLAAATGGGRWAASPYATPEEREAIERTLNAPTRDALSMIGGPAYVDDSGKIHFTTAGTTPIATPAAPLTLRPNDHLDAITIDGLRIACPVVESGSPNGFTILARVDWETCRALQDAWCSSKPVAIGANGRTRQAVPVKFQANRVPRGPAFDVKIEARWWAEPVKVPGGTAYSWANVAAAALTWNGVPAPAKPAALAVGQVWERGGTRYEITGHKFGDRWAALSDGADYLINEADLLRRADCHHLGTREEVTARERKEHPLRVVLASPLDAAQCERIAAKVAEVHAAAKSAFDNAERDGLTLRPAEEIAARAGAAKPSPLATLRAEIDRLIAADSGPFAHARAAALRSLSEPGPSSRTVAPSEVAGLLVSLRQYEERRGGATTPQVDAMRVARLWLGAATLATYERERCRSDTYARRRP